MGNYLDMLIFTVNHPETCIRTFFDVVVCFDEESEWKTQSTESSTELVDWDSSRNCDVCFYEGSNCIVEQLVIYKCLMDHMSSIDDNQLWFVFTCSFDINSYEYNEYTSIVSHQHVPTLIRLFE